MLHAFATKVGQKESPSLTDRQQRIYNFLTAHPIGVLSSITPDNTPHGAVIYFTVDKDFDLFFLTKQYTRKTANLAHNDHVMLTVFEPTSQTTAQIIGRAVELKSTTFVNTVAGAILGASMKTSGVRLPPISKLQAGPYVAFKVEPAQIRMAFYSQPDPGDYTDLFETIESFELEPI